MCVSHLGNYSTIRPLEGKHVCRCKTGLITFETFSEKKKNIQFLCVHLLKPLEEDKPHPAAMNSHPNVRAFYHLKKARPRFRCLMLSESQGANQSIFCAICESSLRLDPPKMAGSPCGFLFKSQRDGSFAQTAAGQK